MVYTEKRGCFDGVCTKLRCWEGVRSVKSKATRAPLNPKT